MIIAVKLHEITTSCKYVLYINDFLISLDDFNLNDFIKAIKFDELKVPNIPFYKAKTKS